MEADYSRLPYPPNHFGSRPSFDTELAGKYDEHTTSRKLSFAARLNILWPLALHCTLSIGIAAIVLVYVQGRHFDVAERTPLVNVIGGKQQAPFQLLQSDFVTMLSVVIVTLRCALMAWGTPLVWRVAVFLMEGRGLSRRNLKTLLRYGVLGPSAYSSDVSAIIIGFLLLAVLAANLVSPILTGSISWVPSNQLARGLSISPARFEDVEDGIRMKQNTTYFYPRGTVARQGFVLESVGRVGLGGGRDTEPGVLKLVSNAVENLAINSTIENVTLPYFQVHSIQWIQNRNDIPALRDDPFGDALDTYKNSTPVSGSPMSFGYALLVPNTTILWSTDPMESTIIQDTRLVVLYYRYDSDTDLRNLILTPTFPPNTYTRRDHGSYFYAYAWVTFSAGVGRCKDYQCIVSSPSTIRNNTPVDLEPHQLTFQALSLAPVVGLHLAGLNTSLPLSWNNIEAYIEAFLVRSYSGAWATLNSRMWSQSPHSNYLPSYPGLLALVDQRRVYAWLGLQLLATLLGAIFLTIQLNRSKYPLTGDTTLTAFYMDTTMIPRSGKDAAYKGDGVLKIEPRDDRLRVKLEHSD